VRAVLALVFHCSGHRHDVREARDVGEVAADFELGAHAGVQAAIELEEQLVAETDRRVRALCALGVQ